MNKMVKELDTSLKKTIRKRFMGDIAHPSSCISNVELFNVTVLAPIM